MTHPAALNVKARTLKPTCRALILCLSLIIAATLCAQERSVPDWVRETEKAPWQARDSQAEYVFRDQLWIAGGWFQSFDAPPRDVWSSPDGRTWKLETTNDVWSSGDGVKWIRETESAPWSPRLWFSATVYRERMWVLGGWSNQPSKNWADVWHSKDGKNWERLATKTMWKERHEHSVFVFQDKLWIAGGMSPPLNSEVWSLHLPTDWKP